ncbi:HNH endonuclease [Gorillibacterium sp. sgz5001074]|uniref:HNH endonuclease n=1 Tax=Gorillibacterium sp. sgz5001074 TaxID=3446695 RepID=UPI003F6782F2
MKPALDACELCGRTGVETTEHHLTPREMGGSHLPTADLCRPCHKQIHALYSNEELAARLSTLEELRADGQIARYLRWIRKQAPGSLPRTRKSRALREKG